MVETQLFCTVVSCEVQAIFLASVPDSLTYMYLLGEVGILTSFVSIWFNAVTTVSKENANSRY